MTALSLPHILLYGLMLSFALGGVLLGGLYVNPRLMLNDFPPEIKAALPPLNATEKRQRGVMGLLFLGMLLVILGLATAQIVNTSGGEPTFLSAFLHTYLVLFIFNLFDLVVLDWFVLLVLKPRFLAVPGAEDLQAAHTLGFHVRAFFKGCVLIAIPALFVALITMLLV
jgi:hypothetical protein